MGAVVPIRTVPRSTPSQTELARRALHRSICDDLTLLGVPRRATWGLELVELLALKKRQLHKLMGA